MTNVKLTLGYRGTHYAGSQRQSKHRNLNTIESEIIRALFSLYGKPVKIVMAGRTDAGVHAEGQVLNYVAPTSIPIERVARALNRRLPSDIRIVGCEDVKSDFSARRSAVSREYKYLFSRQTPPVYLQDFVAPISFSPNLEASGKIRDILLGEHDFSAFRNLGSAEKSTLRTVYDFELRSKNVQNLFTGDPFDYFEMRIRANSFLYRMVRNIMGSLFEHLRGKRTVKEFADQLVLARKVYPFTVAPACGLCLVRVEYP